jgi:chromosome segregation protein
VFLKSLTLKGFKSFADTTTLEFEPGITVVVGPNGSGKSNIVDAVAWVLGAQGPRSLRSTKMEDVIFAGSAKRPALGRAEVSLTIDNSSHILPIGFSEVTITRTLFRSSGESEYAINGVPCRLLDVQELLSDSGVGRQQHVIVSQGQLDAVLNARPEDRRLIIEEAAGVLKFRRRREKAQRRLDATEGNLLRLQDLLREVRRQLKPLERQADAARRHDSLADELRALRLHLAGREIGGLQARLGRATAERAELATASTELRAALARLDTDVLMAEEGMGRPGADDLGDALVRFESLRERARGLAAVLAERRRSATAEMQSTVDQGLVASLDAEAAGLSGTLQEVDVEAGLLAPRLHELADAETVMAAERAAFEADWGTGPLASMTLRPSSQAAEARGELSALRTGVEQGRGEVARVEARVEALGDTATRLAADAEALRAELLETDRAERPLAAAHERAEAARAVAETALDHAYVTAREAQSERHTWAARAEALALALDEARSRAGAERLADIDGVVGTLLDVVEVDEGWQAAFEAAAGEAIAAVVVDGVASARQALAELRRSGLGGSVLALDAAAVPGSLELAASLGGEPVRDHVRSRLPSLERLLDSLLATAVAVPSWEAALDLAMAHPVLVAVTRDGDRFSATGWRTGTGRVGATGAALEEARAQAEAAGGAADRAQADVTAAERSLAAARAAEAEVAAQLDGFDSRRVTASTALERVEGERRHVLAEAEALAAHAAEAARRLEREEGRVAELNAALPGLEADEAAGAQRLDALSITRSRLDERATALAALRTDLEVRMAGLEERKGLAARRLADIETRLHRSQDERHDAAARRERIERLVTAVDRLAQLVEARRSTVDASLGRLREQRRIEAERARAAGERLEQLRRQRTAAERQLAEVLERAQRAELEEAEARLRLETSVEGVRRDLDTEPEAAMSAELPQLPAGTSAPNRVRELERELRLMGPVNPLALEEFEALSERNQFLEGQLEDVKSSRRELAKVIRAIDAEIVQVFSAAYVDVADNFAKLFATLFPGGTGRLSLTDPDDLLETGIEVDARPSGKNVRKLSLLSGGERSLTALAFLFAVFRSRPSPFYLLDEVEAALDDVNLHRFLDLIHEFREEAQLLIVSHQKRTMEAGDCLYGVTMQPGASSKIISERVTADS